MTPEGLSAEERAAISAALGKVNKRIVMNILKKIEDGGIPTEREMEIVRNAGETPPAPPADQPAELSAPAAQSADFRLDVSVPTDRKGQAAFYTAGEKTVKTWAQKGREAGDPAPFSDPEAMVQWWERLREKGVLKHRVPDNLIEAAARWKQMTAPPPPAVAPAAAPPVPDEPLDLSEFENVELSFDLGSKMAKLNYQVHAKLLRDAMLAQPRDEARVRAAHTSFERAFDMWMTSETRKTKIMADQGRMVQKEEVERKLIQLHAPIPKRLKASLRAAWRVLPEPRPPQTVWNEMVDRTVDESCHDLVASFTEQKHIA